MIIVWDRTGIFWAESGRPLLHPLQSSYVDFCSSLWVQSHSETTIKKGVSGAPLNGVITDH